MPDEIAGGETAPAEAPAVVEPVSTTNPISTDPLPEPEPKKEEAPAKEPKEPEKKAPTTREALKAAADKVAKQEKEETAKVESKRDETGKFAPKEGDKPAEKAPEAKAESGKEVAKDQSKEPGKDAPARFSPEAKVAWETAPPPVKAEVHRAIRELEAGIEKHRVAAEAFEQVKDFDELAKKNNTSLRDAMTRYTNLERTLLADPLKGIEQVCDYAGISLRQLAAHVMGQKPDEVQGQNDATVRELKQEIASLKQQIGGVTTSIQQQHVAKVDAQVQEFAASHPRFEELAEDVAFFLKSGKTKDLAEAYSLAERLNPAPASSAAAAPQTRTAPDLQAQAVKGAKSVSGAPGSGSDPGSTAPSSSIKDALRKAMAKAG